jgi:hypothetical protein
MAVYGVLKSGFDWMVVLRYCHFIMTRCPGGFVLRGLPLRNFEILS